ncbi:terminase small subunit [Ralstonia pseudosolanacearum]|uniref:terminase small subunit n=1 Tax=Ralstonia pseudosolanacearum TaxID=1310165 RepID=UPI00201E4AB5|nr:terminase small subunit [Ralstonia pseudosolanacearum]UQY83670.1 terminase small subunit [Ralstonia pseudosolanacearum]
MSRGDKLTPKQLAFVKAYTATGGANGTQAAIAAGYSASGGKTGKLGASVAAHRLLRDPRIIEEIKKEADRRLRAGVCLAAATLEELCGNAQSESVRLQAAQALLDRGGMQLASLSQHTVTIEDKRTDDELLARIAQMQKELGLKVIDAEVVPPKLAALTSRDVSDAVLVERNDTSNRIFE